MSEEKKVTRKRMTEAQWAEAKAMWESGEYTLSDLSKRFETSREHLSRTFNKEGIEKGARSEEIAERVAEEAISSATDKATIRARRVVETNEESYEWSRAVGKMHMRILAKAAQSGASVATTMEEMKTLDRAMSIQQKVQAVRFTALGLDKEDYVDNDDLPELPITNLTDEEMNDIRSRAHQQSVGVDDGLGGILDENEVVEEGFEVDDGSV